MRAAAELVLVAIFTIDKDYVYCMVVAQYY